MKIEMIFDEIAQDYDGIMEISGQKEILLDHIRQATEGLDYQTVLDVGIGSGLSIDGYLNDKVIQILASEPSEGMRQQLQNNVSDERLSVDERPIREIHLEESYDLAVFSLSLAWMEESELSLEHVLAVNPKYVQISEQIINEEERSHVGKGHMNENKLQENFTPFTPKKLDAIMEKVGYFPLRVFVDKLSSVGGDSTGRLRTILYTKTKPDVVPYEKAAAIFQINSFCNRKCVGCYAKSSGEFLQTELYLDQLQRIPEGSLVTFRGGEPTLQHLWFEDYVQPALDYGINVVVETNGAFIDRRDYKTNLQRLSDKRIHIRLSFDEKHLEELNQQRRDTEFKKLARFVNDATEKGISFGFYALGMDQHQISRMIDGTELEPYEHKFHSLTSYSDITELPISGMYIDVSGKKHDSLVS